jgi:hypothetical protein
MPNVQVNATISARDAASKNIKTVNRALGTLGKTASSIGSDFKKLTFGIAGIAAGVGAFTASAIKDAALDEQATAKLNAALKARGFATEAVAAAVEKQIVAGQKLAFTDDEVRASVEASTRFTKDYAVAQKMQTIAMNLARTTGMDLGDATIAVGKAYAGAGGKLLTSLGITKKGIKGQEALNALFKKTKGAAGAYADSVAGSFESLKIGAFELKEQFGKAFLPAIGKLFKALNPYIEKLSNTIKANTPQLQKWADIIVNKIIGKLPKMFDAVQRGVPRALKAIEGFVDKISSIGKGADDLLGPGGSITLLVSGIGAAFGGLKGAITANLVKDGMDPFTALVVANIAAQIPAALASALVSSVVTKAVAAFGTSVAVASAGGTATSAAAGVGGAAAGGGLLAGLALPVTIVALSLAATAALTDAIVKGNMTNKIGGNNVIDIFGTTAATTATTPPKDIFKDLGDLWTFITTGVQPTTNVTPVSGSTTNNVYIGTGKVDTVVSDSITRLKRQGRNP